MSQDEQERTLRLEVPLVVGDYFRSYLDGIKMKLVVAAIIYAVVTAAFVSFFVFIGEQEVLMQTSPLFLGAPAVVVVGQLLRAHASTRKYIASLSEVERILRFSFRTESNGYDLVQGDNSSHVAWSSMRGVVEKGRYFEFRLNKYVAHIIPKRVFHNKSEEEFLRMVLRSQLGARAKLVESNNV